MFKRISALWNADRRKVLVSLCALAVASMVVLGSGADFTSTSENPVVYTAGNLKHDNSKDGLTILDVKRMKPGDTVANSKERTGTVVIKNDGDLDSDFSVKSTLSNETKDLTNALDLTVECTSGCATTAVYSGDIDGFNKTLEALTADDPDTAPDEAESQTYKFTVEFPDGGPNGADNAYKAGTADVTYEWETKQQ